MHLQTLEIIIFLGDDLFIAQKRIDLSRFVTLTGCDQKLRQLELQIPVLFIPLRISLQETGTAGPVSSGTVQVRDLEDRRSLLFSKLLNGFFELLLRLLRFLDNRRNILHKGI